MSTNMFRLLRKQAFRKTVPKPFRISAGTASRWIHNQSPYTGPPSYDTIARRFSSNFDPQAYITQKRQRQDIERGEYLDIHDIGLDPNDYDVLLTDVNDENLRSEVADAVGMKYLAKASEADANEVIKAGNGIIYGVKLRTIFPAVVACDGQAHWIFFVFDAGSPLTYLSNAACELFNIKEARPENVKIAGYLHQVAMSPSRSHFHEVNILGADFITRNNVCARYNYKQSTVKFYFGDTWEVTKKVSA